MKFFYDGASLEKIKELIAMGLYDGNTTNDTILAKVGKNPREHLEKIFQLSDYGKPISVELNPHNSDDAQAMFKEGLELDKKFRSGLVLKVPCTFAGLKVIKMFVEEAIETNLTLCFSVIQAVLGARAGATYVSPFVGRLDDIGDEGMGLVAEIKKAYELYGFKTQIIVASIRSPLHVKKAIMIGADIVTVPYDVMKKLMFAERTEDGIKRFRADYDALQEKLARDVEV